MQHAHLGCVLNANIGDSEGVDSPVQIESMLGLPERQSFSQSCFVNLNDIDTCLLKIFHFILDGQCNLIASFKSRNNTEKKNMRSA